MIATAADFAIPLGALVVAGGALLTTSRTIRTKAGADAVQSIQSRQDSADRRAEDHELRLSKCEDARDQLTDTNIRLMKKLLRVDDE